VRNALEIPKKLVS